VHLLLGFLAEHGFAGAPRPVRLTEDGVDEVSFLPGETVGTRRPWPRWVHTEDALLQVARWLRSYHDVVSDFSPPPGLLWRETHAEPGPGVVIAHNDTAPYNAVWNRDRLVGFVDWDMAGPRLREDDLAWTAFSWVPLHARHVVAAEGFTELGHRRQRLAAFLSAYGSMGTTGQVLARLEGVITQQVALMRSRAAQGDRSYQKMIQLGRVHDLQTARQELSSI
jgi:aminoglycoside phosphotransferase (APT) family kinase protein